jgi:anti-sigma regulatory factor (Ser/Thr protein kinase)
MPRRSFAAYPASVPAARGWVADQLAHSNPELHRTAALLVSELATNVVRHAGTLEFTVDVQFPTADGQLRVSVTDTGLGYPSPQHPDPTEEHGRGLQLVATLADRWGAIRRHVPREKTVWFELTLASATPRAD